MKQDSRRTAQPALVTTLVSCLIGTGMVSLDAYAGDGCPLPACVIEFDESCPNAGEECGAIFAGGVGCVIDFLPFCYNSGEFSYRVNEGAGASISLLGDLIALDVFFANVEGSSGEMRFFNADKNQIGEPIQTNGECELFMPKVQSRVFEEPVRFIEVSALGGQVYIDSFSVNPGFEPPLGDLNGDCVVGAADILALLRAWGPCADPCPPSCPADLNEDCVVGAADILLLLANWG